LEGVAADPERRLSALPLLAPEEERQLLARGTGPALALAGEPSVAEAVARWARRTP